MDETAPSSSGPEDTSFKNLPLSEKLVSKNWKARQDGYLQLLQSFDSAASGADPIFHEHAECFKKMLQDSNSACLEAALNAVTKFVEKCSSPNKYAADICEGLIDGKCLNGRPGVKAKATEIVMILIEAECTASVVETLVNGFKHKNAKIAAATLECLTLALRSFGTQVIIPKSFLNMKTLSALLESVDKDVRAQAKALISESFRWVKDAVRPVLESVRDATKTDLEKSFAEISEIAERPSASRHLRSYVAPSRSSVAPTGAASSSRSDAPVEQRDEVDAFDFLEAFDLLTWLEKDQHKNWPDHVLGLEKWIEKKGALDAANAQIQAKKKLAPGDYGDIVRMLKKLLSDSNQTVSTAAIKCFGLLAFGLRKEFSGHARVYAPVLLERFKEKNKIACNECKNALTLMHQAGCFTLVEFSEDITAIYKKMQVPSGRQEIVTWIGTVAGTPPSTRAVLLKGLKPIGDVLLEGLNDPDDKVRKSSVEAFASFSRVVGPKASEPFINSLDKLKQEAVRKALAVDGPGPPAEPSKKPASAATAAPAAAAAAAAAPVAKSGAPPKTSPRATPTDDSDRDLDVTAKKKPAPAKKPAAASSSSSAAPGAKKKGPVMDDKDEDIEFKLTPEEVLMRVEPIVPEEIRTKVTSSSFKDRVEAMVALIGHLESMDDGELDQNSELLIQYLSKCPGWKDSQFQVITKVAEAATLIAKRATSFNKKCAASAVNGLAEKIHDAKLGRPITELYLCVCESVGPRFVLDQLMKASKEMKNPKCVSETFLFMTKAVEEFGTQFLNIKALIEHVKWALENTNPAIKTSSMRLLVMIRRYMGPDVRNFFNDGVKPQLQSTIDAEFAKVNDQNPPEPTRSIRGMDTSAPAASSGGELPRADISNKITSDILSEMGDKNWQTRSQAMKKVEDIVNAANRRITGDGLGDLMTSLKQRASDSNRNLAVSAMNVMTTLASAAGKGIEKYSRVLVPAVLGQLGDQKQNVRQAVAKTLDVFVAEMGILPLVDSLPKAMVVQSTDGRQEILQWIVKYISDLEKANIEFDPFVKPLITCLQDKNHEVRKVAETLLVPIIKQVGYDAVLSETKDLNAASVLALKPVLEKARAACGPMQAAEREVDPADVPEPALPNGKPVSKTSRPASAAGSSRTALSSTLGRKAAPASSSSQAPSVRASLAGTKLGACPEPPCTANSDKTKRKTRMANQVKVLLDEPRPEIIEELKLQLQPYVAKFIHDNMFNKDSQKQCSAANEFLICLPAFKKEIGDNLDLILKWMGIRIFEGNTAVVLKATEFVTLLVEVMAQDNLALEDFEANNLLPFLVSQFGSQKDAVKANIRQIFRSIVKVYPASKLFMFIAEGARSKNAKVRKEAIDEMSFMIDKHGLEAVCVPSKIGPSLAACLSLADAPSRDAALSLLMKLAEIQGKDAMFKVVGGITDPVRKTLEDRLRREAQKNAQATAQRPPSTLSTPKLTPCNSDVSSDSGRQQTPPSVRSASPEISYRPSGPAGHRASLPSPGPFRPRAESDFRLESPDRPRMAGSTLTASSSDPSLSHHYHPQPHPSARAYAPPSSMPPPPAVVPSQTSYSLPQQPSLAPRPATAPRPSPFASSSSPQEWLALLQSNEQAKKVEGMKCMVNDLTLNDGAILANNIDNIIYGFTEQIHLCFAGPTMHIQTCKYVLNTLMQIFTRRPIAARLSQDALQQLVHVLLDRMVDENLKSGGAPGMEDDGAALVRALNLLLLKVLENSDRTTAYCVLVNSLRLSLNPNTAPSAADPKKIIELLVRCLLKSFKNLAATIHEVRLERLLLEVHLFLEAAPAVSATGFESDSVSSMPNRTIRTLINEIIKGKGAAVRDYLFLIPPAPTGKSPPPVLIQLLDLLLLAPELSQPMPQAPSSSGQSPTPLSAPLSRMPQPSPTSELDTIFKRIGSKETSKLGLQELQKYIQNNGETQVWTQLTQFGPSFQQYIKRHLSAASVSPSPVTNTALSSMQQLSPSKIDPFLEGIRNINATAQTRPGTAPPAYSSLGHQSQAQNRPTPPPSYNWTGADPASSKAVAMDLKSLNSMLSKDPYAAPISKSGGSSPIRPSSLTAFTVVTPELSEDPRSAHTLLSSAQLHSREQTRSHLQSLSERVNQITQANRRPVAPS